MLIYKFKPSKNYLVLSISFYRFFLLLLNKIISSAKNKIGIIFKNINFYGTLTPKFASSRINSNFSITNENNNGLKTHPCFIPMLISIF